MIPVSKFYIAIQVWIVRGDSTDAQIEDKMDAVRDQVRAALRLGRGNTQNWLGLEADGRAVVDPEYRTLGKSIYLREVRPVVITVNPTAETGTVRKALAMFLTSAVPLAQAIYAYPETNFSPQSPVILLNSAGDE